MELIAGAKVDRGLIHGRMKRVLIVELHVQFQFSGDVPSHHQSEKSSILPFAHELVAHFVIHIDRAELSREFDGEQERFARRSDAPADRIVGVIQKELREGRNVKPRLPFVVEAPLYPGIGLAHPIFGRGGRALNAQPGILVCELDAIANTEIDINVRGVGDRLVAVKEGHVAEIDFPIQIARCTRIVGVVGRSPLGEGRSNGE